MLWLLFEFFFFFCFKHGRPMELSLTPLFPVSSVSSVSFFLSLFSLFHGRPMELH